MPPRVTNYWHRAKKLGISFLLGHTLGANIHYGLEYVKRNFLLPITVAKVRVNKVPYTHTHTHTHTNAFNSFKSLAEQNIMIKENYLLHMNY